MGSGCHKTSYPVPRKGPDTMQHVCVRVCVWLANNRTQMPSVISPILLPLHHCYPLNRGSWGLRESGWSRDHFQFFSKLRKGGREAEIRKTARKTTFLSTHSVPSTEDKKISVLLCLIPLRVSWFSNPTSSL